MGAQRDVAGPIVLRCGGGVRVEDSVLCFGENRIPIGPNGQVVATEEQAGRFATAIMATLILKSEDGVVTHIRPRPPRWIATRAPRNARAPHTQRRSRATGSRAPPRSAGDDDDPHDHPADDELSPGAGR